MRRSKEVDEFFQASDNPMKEEMKVVRDIILGADEKISESIKWSAPSFAYKDNLCTFNPRAKKFVNLTFHKGALIDDETGLLEGDKPEARVARFYDMADINKKREKLETVVRKWVEVMDA